MCVFYPFTQTAKTPIHKGTIRQSRSTRQPTRLKAQHFFRNAQFSMLVLTTVTRIRHKGDIMGALFRYVYMSLIHLSQQPTLLVDSL